MWGFELKQKQTNSQGKSSVDIGMTKTTSELCRDDNGPTIIVSSLFSPPASSHRNESQTVVGASEIPKAMDRGLFILFLKFGR